MNKFPSPMRFIFLITILSAIHVSLFAEKAPIKFGKIEKADLEMRVFPSDTSAVAAILCDYGYFNSTQFKFVRILRIKIFKKEGTNWANQVFYGLSKGNIRGITFNLENGEIIESNLKSESVFYEKVNKDMFSSRVAMPNVKEGSIIDLEFNVDGLPYEWRFQEEVPVRWSELIIEPSQNITFSKIFFGFEHLSESSDTRWVAKNMPAFKKEPYMNSVKNYMTRYEIELLSIGLPPKGYGYNGLGYYQEFCTSWEAVNDRLRESEYFGKAMNGCASLNSIASDIEKNFTDSLKRLQAAHEAIKKAVKWNDNKSVYSSWENLNIIYNKKMGNSGDINLMLILLLKKLNFEVYPVALSTRDNGFLSPLYPSLDKLNYVIACVYLNSKQYLLDATDQNLPIDMLPDRCINLQGRLIDGKKSQWVDLLTEKKNKKFIQFDLKLEENNDLTGSLTKTNYEYASLDFRNTYEQFNSKEEYLKNFESLHLGLNVVNCDITNIDSIYRPLQEIYEVNIKNKVSSAGNLLYITPLLYEQISSNPFKTVERKYPVDFIYPSEVNYILRLSLPEGIQVEQLPTPFSMKLKDGSATFQYQVNASNNMVQLNYKFALKKSIFSEVEYSDLRAFFSEMVKKHAEQIVLKKI